MKKINKTKGDLTVTFSNVDESQIIALTHMFKYWEHLGNIGSSRKTTFFADGDGSFRPKVSVSCDMDLPEIPSSELECIKPSGEFEIDPDTIAWKIYE
ncbi:MAG: hypothetical protein ACRDD8_03940 [Bacteroidales bacterium]